MVVPPLFLGREGFFFLLTGRGEREKRKIKRHWSLQSKVKGLAKVYSLLCYKPFLLFPGTFLLEFILLTNELEEEAVLTLTV